MKKLFAFLSSTVLVFTAGAQHRFAVHNAFGGAIYNTLDSAFFQYMAILSTSLAGLTTWALLY